MTAELLSSILIFIVGLGLGVLTQRYILNKRSSTSKLEKELTELRGEHLQLKDSLHQHFYRTADLTKNLTDSYQALYEHIAQGADTFSEQPLAELKHVLDNPSRTNHKEPPKDYAEELGLKEVKKEESLEVEAEK